MASHPDPRLSSEAYRQELVRDGQRRFAEWHQAYQHHCQQYRTSQIKTPTLPSSISSEAYRQKLVRDGQRRFEEWHQNFLDYQRKFLTEINQ
jgi:hypothetical protein